MLSWKLGLKANALYRDGSKLSQPLTSQVHRRRRGRSEAVEPDRQSPAARAARSPRRSSNASSSASSASAAAAAPPQGLHAEGGRRRPQGLSPHRRIRGRPPRRDLHRHAQGGRRVPRLMNNFAIAISSACNTACRSRSTSTPSPSRASNPPASCRATRRSRTRRRSSTTSSASSPFPISAGTISPTSIRARSSAARASVERRHDRRAAGARSARKRVENGVEGPRARQPDRQARKPLQRRRSALHRSARPQPKARRILTSAPATSIQRSPTAPTHSQSPSIRSRCAGTPLRSGADDEQVGTFPATHIGSQAARLRRRRLL